MISTCSDRTANGSIKTRHTQTAAHNFTVLPAESRQTSAAVLRQAARHNWTRAAIYTPDLAPARVRVRLTLLAREARQTRAHSAFRIVNAHLQRDVYLKSICIWKVFSSTFFFDVFVFVFEEFFEKVFLFLFVFVNWKNSAFKYKYILFQKILFIWSLFLTS